MGRYKGRLIVAEDEALVALGIQLMLTDAGHEVCGVASTAPESVRLAEMHAPDLALVDVRLAHGTDGLAAVSKLQAHLGIPSLLVTAHASYAEADAAGALGWLRKPFRPDELVRIVDAALAWLHDGLVEAPVPQGLILSRWPFRRRYRH